MAKLIHVGFPDEAWFAAILAVAHEGERVDPRGLASRELRDVTLVIDHPSWLYDLTMRDMAWKIGIVEGMSMAGQTSVPEYLTKRVRRFRQWVQSGILWGAYGARLSGQLELCALTLSRDIYSRQAVMTIFDGLRDLDRDQADIPCTVSVQFLYRGDLHMRVSMRSNDLWIGTPYDLLQFAILHHVMAETLNLKVGQYTHTVGSMHLYERDVEIAEHLVRNEPEVVRWGSNDPWFLKDPDPDEKIQERLDAIATLAREVLAGRHVDDTNFLAYCTKILEPKTLR